MSFIEEIIIGFGKRTIRLGGKMHKTVTIEPVKPIGCTHPQKAIGIPECRQYILIAQAIRSGVI